MIAMRTHVRPKNRRISVRLPPEFSQSAYEMILLPVEVPAETAPSPRYDFSDLAGRLQWKGDAVAAQRAIRDEW